MTASLYGDSDPPILVQKFLSKKDQNTVQRQALHYCKEPLGSTQQLISIQLSDFHIFKPNFAPFSWLTTVVIQMCIQAV